MKIAYICSDADIQILGHHGCSVHIREFTGALVDAGHDVFIICRWLGDDADPDIVPRARVYHLQPQGMNQSIWDAINKDPFTEETFLDRDVGSMLWNTWLQVDGAKILEEEKPDFIYERYSLFGFGGKELSLKFNIPLILELNSPLCDQQEGYYRFPFIRSAREMESQIIRSADAVVALTDWLSDWALGMGVDQERISILPDAVSEPIFGEVISGEIIRGKHNISENEVVGFVGSFHKWHDVSGLIDSFYQLYESNSDRRLLLVGDGHDRKKLETKVANLGLTQAVIFTGKVAHEAVPQYMAAMDVAVVPYQPIEDFFFSPMKLFESMAVGVPTVAADLGQISQIVRNLETGILYPPGDNVILSEAIDSLLRDKKLASDIGAAAREYVLQNHTWGKVTSEVVDIAKRLIGR
jgi:glycosyltransferase involved in cell wall biosynthesis